MAAWGIAWLPRVRGVPMKDHPSKAIIQGRTGVLVGNALLWWCGRVPMRATARAAARCAAAWGESRIGARHCAGSARSRIYNSNVVLGSASSIISMVPLQCCATALHAFTSLVWQQHCWSLGGWMGARGRPWANTTCPVRSQVPATQYASCQRITMLQDMVFPILTAAVALRAIGTCGSVGVPDFRHRGDSRKSGTAVIENTSDTRLRVA